MRDEIVRLGSVVVFSKGSGLAKTDITRGGAEPCVHYGELFTQYGAVIDKPRSRTHLKLQRRSRAGDVLMPTSDVTPRGLAKASALLVDGVGLGGDILILRPDTTRIDPRFLAYAIRQNERQVLSLVRGSTVFHLYATDMSNFLLYCPLLKIQQSIATTLADADQLIATLERLITKKQAIKQGMMQELLSGQTRLPGFTDKWSEVELGEMAQFSKGVGLPKSALEPGAGNLCIHYGELFTHYGPEIHDVASRTPLKLPRTGQAQDVLMPTSDVTPRGLAKASAVLVDGVGLGGDILVIRPQTERLYGPYLAHTIRYQAEQILQLVHGSTVYHLYAADMKNFRFKKPSVDEQRAICEVFREAQRELYLLSARLRKVRNVKQGMMQELLTGGGRG